MRVWLRKIRESKKLTKKEAAVMAEISESFYDKIERGERNAPVKTAKKIAAALGFDWNLFFEEE